MLNGNPLPARLVSKDDLEAIIPPEAIPKAGTYIVTLKCEGEPFPESHRAHLVVAINRSTIPAEGELSIESPELVNVGKQTAKLKTRAC